MINTTLKRIPDRLYQRLRQAAARNHRSINEELLERLATSLAPATRDVDAELAAIRALRPDLGITTDAIDDMKREGRA